MGTLIDTAPYERLQSRELDIIFGQHVSKSICDLPLARNRPPDCSLAATPHYAPDDEGRPPPIGEGGEYFDLALEAAVKYFAERGHAVEIILHHALTGARDVYVTLAKSGELVSATTEYVQLDAPVDREHAAKRRRRAILVCLLALAAAPTAIALQVPR